MEEKKKLEFYGGAWMSFLPFVIFLVLIVLTTFHFGSISDGALWLPAFLALIVAFFFAKNKRQYAETMIAGMASKEAIIPGGVLAFRRRLFPDPAGIRPGRRRGGDRRGHRGWRHAVHRHHLYRLRPVRHRVGYGVRHHRGGHGGALSGRTGSRRASRPAGGAIISGAAFGDNLAPVSDTTICSATSQGVDVPGVVRSRLKYALAAGGLTVAGLVIAGLVLSGSGGGSETPAYNPWILLMFLPVAATIFVAVKSGDIIIAATIGIVSGAVVAVAAGLMDIVQIDVADAVKPALFTVSGEGLDRAVGGVLYTGLSSMIQVIVLALLLFGCTSIMRAGGGDEKLLAVLGRVVRGPRGAEVVISVMVILLSALMGLNAPAILAIGASFAAPLAKRYGISPYRTANLLDAQSNTLCYCLPWTPAVVYTLGFAADSAHPLTAMQVSPFVFYSFAMLAVMVVTILLGIGRKDGTRGTARRDGGAQTAEPLPELEKVES